MRQNNLQRSRPGTRLEAPEAVAPGAVPVYHRAMFFALSKILWFLFKPGTVVLVGLSIGVVLLWSRWRRLGRWVVTLSVVAILVMAMVPLGTVLGLMLENRFPVVRKLPGRVHGIVVLGGVVDQLVTRARGQIAIGGAVERLTEFAALARRYPEARLVFTSGSGLLLRQDVKEADVVAPLLATLGLDPGRVIFERQSRNTFENAVMSHALVDPKPDQTWILITSAFHMPRAVGSFRAAGWRVIPYPVDFAMRGDEGLTLTFTLGGVGGLGGVLHEWVGLAMYRLSGKTDAFFPAP